MPASKPNYPPKAPPANAVALGFRALTYEWGGEGRGGINTQSITIFIIIFVVPLQGVLRFGTGFQGEGRKK